MKIALRTAFSLLLIASANSACAQNPVTTPSLPPSKPAEPIITAASPAPAVVTPQVPAAPTQIAAVNAEYESFFNEAVTLINRYRASKNLSSLARDNRLDTIATNHSRYMAAKDDLSHAGFNERFDQANMQSCAENVAWNQITADELVNDWIGSPVHDKNLLKPNVTRVGMGRAKGYTTYFVCQP